MILTNQQQIILFDIVKGCLYSDIQQFAGYSKETIMKLINDIIAQQDNVVYVEPFINKANTNIISVSESKESETDENNFWD
jgi:hypothetical protein